MKLIAVVLILLSYLTAHASSCDTNEFFKSIDGNEKLTNLTERAKSLILSKLEDLGIEEDQVQIKVQFPNEQKKIPSLISVILKSKSLKVEGSNFNSIKTFRDEACGLEIVISGGRLLNKESGKDFGSLGKVKEFIRINL